jgi:hypothetical protein
VLPATVSIVQDHSCLRGTHTWPARVEVSVQHASTNDGLGRLASTVSGLLLVPRKVKEPVKLLNQEHTCKGNRGTHTAMSNACNRGCRQAAASIISEVMPEFCNVPSR